MAIEQTIKKCTLGWGEYLQTNLVSFNLYFNFYFDLNVISSS